MTGSEALRSIQRMILMFGGRAAWDEGTIASWTEEVAKLSDYEAACEATTRLVQTWENQGRPPFAAWLKVYNTVRQRHIEQGNHVRAIERGAMYKPITAFEYMDLLLERARKGSEDAKVELGNFFRSGYGARYLNERELNDLGIDTRRPVWATLNRQAASTIGWDGAA